MKDINLHEKIFITAGVLMIFSVPFLNDWGFSAWFAVKIVYLTGLIVIYVRHRTA